MTIYSMFTTTANIQIPTSSRSSLGQVFQTFDTTSVVNIACEIQWMDGSSANNYPPSEKGFVKASSWVGIFAPNVSIERGYRILDNTTGLLFEVISYTNFRGNHIEVNLSEVDE